MWSFDWSGEQLVILLELCWVICFQVYEIYTRKEARIPTTFIEYYIAFILMNCQAVKAIIDLHS